MESKGVCSVAALKRGDDSVTVGVVRLQRSCLPSSRLSFIGPADAESGFVKKKPP